MKYLIPLLISLFWAAPASAGFDDGMATYEQGDHATAFREFSPLADQGDATAQYWLGVIHASGDGVPQNYGVAASWFRLAAEQGHALAQFTLGLMYANGDGVPQDYGRAYMWSNIAAMRLPSGRNRDRAILGQGLIAVKMSGSQVAEARRMAQKWNLKTRLTAQIAPLGQTNEYTRPCRPRAATKRPRPPWDQGLGHETNRISMTHQETYDAIL